MLASYKKFIEKKASNPWVYENLRYLPLLLLVQLLFVALWLILLIINNEGGLDKSALTLHSILFQIELFIIPVCAINTTFLAQRIAAKKNLSSTKTILYKLLAAVIGVIIGTAITESIYASFGIVDDDVIALGKYTIDPITTNFISYALLSIFIAIPLFIKQAKRYELLLELKEKELQVQQAEQLIAKAELETLQAKINPHFLYNSLNSIAGLIHDEPDKAESMVLSLSDLFRYSLNTQSKSYTTVDEEIKMVNTYMDIEKTRFEDQLEYTIDIDEEAKSYLIPRFLIQPLVENAIKHGTSKIEKGKMELSIKKSDNGLTIRVADNGPDFPPQMSNGYGVRNVREKLNLLFPEKNEIVFNNHPEKYIEIEIQQLKKQTDEV